MKFSRPYLRRWPYLLALTVLGGIALVSALNSGNRGDRLGEMPTLSRSRAPTVASASDAGAPPNATLAVQVDLSSIWTDLATAAQADAKAADQLAHVISTCQLLLPHEYTGATKPRFSQPAWRALTNACTPEMMARMTQALATSSRATSPEVEALGIAASEAGDSVERLAARDELAVQIIRDSADPDAVAFAAHTYLDNDRMMVWGEGNLPNSLLTGDTSNFAMDTAISLACRAGADCSPWAPRVMAECASTNLCSPPMTMDQIIGLRQSPQERALMEEYLRRLLAMRGNGG